MPRFPRLPYGNCHIYSILFKIHNWKDTKYVLNLVKLGGKWVLSSHVEYKDMWKILYRSRPKGNTTRIFFRGRPQILPLERIPDFDKNNERIIIC